ncbi:unnamed protein product, partial [Rotaria socialis]
KHEKNNSGINVTKELEGVINKTTELMRSYGAIIISSVNISSFNSDQAFDDLWSLLMINFPEDIANYLIGLSNTTIRSLTDLIEFNIKHADEEFHPLFAPNQDLFELSNNVSNISYANQSSLLNRTRTLGGQLGIDLA